MDGGSRICFYDLNKEFISRVNSPVQVFQFTTPLNCAYIRASNTQGYDTFQIEKGSTATTFEPYKSTTYPISLGTIELCKIGDYQDRIYKDNGKWYLYKTVEKLILNGTETWYARETNTSGSYRFYMNISGEKTPNINADCICSHLVNSTIDLTYFCKNGITTKTQYPSYYGNLLFYNEAFKTYTIAQVQQALSEENYTVYYVLATPTTTEITDGTLINQLETILAMKTYKNSTTLTTTGADLSPIVDLTLTNALKKENLYTAGTNVSIDENNVISATDTTYSNATTTTDGLMSKEDKDKLDGIISEILLLAHPVGSYYWSSENTNPATLFGGTWVQVTDKFILAAGSTYTAGDTGGSATVTLTKEQMPSHTHTFTGNALGNHKHTIKMHNTEQEASGYGVSQTATFTNRVLITASSNFISTENASAGTPSGTNSDTGGGQAHNNMPPYEVAYCWKRVPTMSSGTNPGVEINV